MISYCGIKCLECNAYIATKNNDDKLRAETAAEWSKMYGGEVKPESINCHGCKTTDGVLFSHCKVCNIRACGEAKKVDNCGACPDFRCKKINEFYEMAPDLKDAFGS